MASATAGFAQMVRSKAEGNLKRGGVWRGVTGAEDIRPVFPQSRGCMIRSVGLP